MTLPASGPLSLDDINVELGRSPNALISLFSATTGVYAAINTCSIPFPDGTAPYAISDWYGYNHLAPCLNSYYAMSDGQTGTFNGLYSNTFAYDTVVSATRPDPGTSDCSWSFWFKPVVTSETNGTIHTLEVDPDTKIVIAWTTFEQPGNPGVYTNKLTFNFDVNNPPSPAGFIDSECNISDATNTTISGVVDTDPWGVSSNFGNVDSTDYVLITIVVENAQVGTSDFVQWYWNDNRLDVPYQSGGQNISFTQADNLDNPDWNDAVMTIGGSNTGDLPCWGQLDGFSIYLITNISQANVTAIYNGGAVADMATYTGISTNLLYYNFELDTPNIGRETGGNYTFNLDELNSPTRVQDPAQ